MHRRTGSILLVILVAALAATYFVFRRPAYSPINTPEPQPAQLVATPAPLFGVDPPANSPVQAIIPASLTGQDLLALAQAADRLPDNLSHGEQAALIRFLNPGADSRRPGADSKTLSPTVRHDAYVFLANQVMDALLRQRHPHPMMVEGFISIWENASLDATARDYALQHLGAWLHRHLAEDLTPQEREAATPQIGQVIDSLFGATQPGNGHSCGTALLGLHHAFLAIATSVAPGSSTLTGPWRSHPFDLKRLQETVVRVALDSKYPVTARCTAFQIAAQRGWPGVLAEARMILEAGSAPPQLVGSVAATLGALGNLEHDGPILVRGRASADPRIAASTKAALLQLERKSHRSF